MTGSLAGKKLVRVIHMIMFTVFFDQLSKHCILGLRNLNMDMLPILNMKIVWNYGVSFGFFNNPGQDQMLLCGISIFAIILLLLWMWNEEDEEYVVVGAMIVGGACGNLIDRIIHGAVLDFIDFHILDYHYPTFNWADVFIVIGAIRIIYRSYCMSAKDLTDV
ncbi:signal peptidase II [Rickettsiales endosymbiont of Peranema trichophorum]|uniref:signal peptidase II n=1 Tax=Rickettsiales endosymbiont of Peranema trichophorum TaxID=2486577 RepID=UPI001023E9D7|nr:signal peptidase II [Rickettsiales endosymbiont of Peranema trichophorum]RZI47800.1 signal peptidase II [Rickettsiales endosymbiont of Peranema trichophorum]